MTTETTLPALTGSPKQIGWAKEIRQTALAVLPQVRVAAPAHAGVCDAWLRVVTGTTRAQTLIELLGQVIEPTEREGALAWMGMQLDQKYRGLLDGHTAAEMTQRARSATVPARRWRHEAVADALTILEAAQ